MDATQGMTPLPQPAYARQPPAPVLGIVSLALGVVALVIGILCPVFALAALTDAGIETTLGTAFLVGTPIGLGAIVTGIAAIRTGQGRGLGIAAICIAGVAALMPAVSLLLYMFDFLVRLGHDQ